MNIRIMTESDLLNLYGTLCPQVEKEEKPGMANIGTSAGKKRMLQTYTDISMAIINSFAYAPEEASFEKGNSHYSHFYSTDYYCAGGTIDKVTDSDKKNRY